MANVYPKVSNQTGKRLHILGYLAGDLAGIGAGFAVGKFIHEQFHIPLLTAIGGLVVAGAVAVAILLLVCYLAGTWNSELTPYLYGEDRATKAACGRGYFKTNRGLLKLILLSIVTFGIYGIVVLTSISMDINLIAGKYDGKKTMNYCLIYFLFTGLTLGIAPLVWYHRLSARIGNELKRRGIVYDFNAGTFWLWYLLGLFIAIGPLIYLHKLFKAMNLLSEDCNENEWNNSAVPAVNS